MFISKAEKDSINEALVSHAKSMQELKRRIHQLEETVAALARQKDAVAALARIGAILETPEEPEPVVNNDPTDYKELFKTSKKRETRTPGLTNYE